MQGCYRNCLPKLIQTTTRSSQTTFRSSQTTFRLSQTTFRSQQAPRYRAPSRTTFRLAAHFKAQQVSQETKPASLASHPRRHHRQPLLLEEEQVTRVHDIYIRSLGLPGAPVIYNDPVEFCAGAEPLTTIRSHRARPAVIYNDLVEFCTSAPSPLRRLGLTGRGQLSFTTIW